MSSDKHEEVNEIEEAIEVETTVEEKTNLAPEKGKKDLIKGTSGNLWLRFNFLSI